MSQSGFSLFFFLGLLLLAACERTPSHEAIVARELARPDTVREIFLNYELGMLRQAFYDSSWALNRRGLVRQGPQNQNVLYKIPDALPYEATMLYYPDFKDDRVVQMRASFQYDAWAPWNRRLWSDSLLLDVRQLMETWYGEGFMIREISVPLKGLTHGFVKIDANRQITIRRASDSDVLVLITDLRATLPEGDG